MVMSASREDRRGYEALRNGCSSLWGIFFLALSDWNIKRGCSEERRHLWGTGTGRGRASVRRR